MKLIATQSCAQDKFANPKITADGQPRASVELQSLDTLWFNTGTLCNLTCTSCYIESSPSNDRLVYLTLQDVDQYLDEIAAEALPVKEVGITGGEPFMNPHILPILESCLARGFRVLVLTNAMRPMMKCAEGLLRLVRRFGAQLTIRVSIDHYARGLHEEERGLRSWQPMVNGLRWLSDNDFCLSVAGRTRWSGSESELRTGFANLFSELDVSVDAHDPQALVVFPEMDETVDVPEITEACWSILGVEPSSLMCATSRMVVKRKTAAHPEVVACTLIPYDPEFSLGRRLADSTDSIALNHTHCARFCVLGGGSCTG